ncbi:hypothetical protein [Saccharopolyspora spinosa]|uniref:hypothetical protein n=1 Tax=Saccharopolyspora spinosa TaxID=60894 RepID=UPI000315094D|nr:hypothetical protein [Saccharopolyspora spinosa]
MTAEALHVVRPHRTRRSDGDPGKDAFYQVMIVRGRPAAGGGWLVRESNLGPS